MSISEAGHELIGQCFAASNEAFQSATSSKHGEDPQLDGLTEERPDCGKIPQHQKRYVCGDNNILVFKTAYFRKKDRKRNALTQKYQLWNEYIVSARCAIPRCHLLRASVKSKPKLLVYVNSGSSYG